MAEDLTKAVRYEVRFNTKDHNDQTRAQRNALAEVEGIPDNCIYPSDLPSEALPLWQMFWGLSAHRVERRRISPTDMTNWLRLNGKRIATVETPIIEAMDAVFVNTLADEIKLNEARRNTKT